MSDAADATRLFAFDDRQCAALAERYGTPAFAYDAATATRAFRRLGAALPPRVRLAYAVKANPHPELLRAFAALGAAFDCASGGELARLRDLQLPPGRLLFAGPGKRAEELALAFELGARVQAESWEDLERLERLAARPVAVNLRVHPLAGGAERVSIIGGSGPSAFGVDEEAVPELLERARRARRVAIRGLHVFTASNERDAERLLAVHSRVFALAERLHHEHALAIEQIDLGGGLGVPYAADETPLDVQRLGRGLADLLARHPWFAGELVLEPGRYLAAGCGVYLVRVVRIKESRGTRFAVLEAGINHLLRPALTGQPFPVRAVNRPGIAQPTTLAGPLCTALDRLGEVALPALAPGDLLAFGMAGAYGRNEAMLDFLSHPPPREIWVAGPVAADVEGRPGAAATRTRSRSASSASGASGRPRKACTTSRDDLARPKR